MPDSAPTPANDSTAPFPTGALVLVVGFAAIGWVLVAVITPGSPSPFDAFLVGLVLGTMFGQASLSATWCALGPFFLARRLPLAFLWLAMLTFAFSLNVAIQGRRSDLVVVLIYGGCLLLQWLLVQVPLWLLVAVWGLRIQRGTAAIAASSRDHQFGIRQIMILTALVAVVLGVGRWALGGMTTDQWEDDWRMGLLIFAFLGMCNTLIAFPLVAAALMRSWQWMIPAMAAAICLVALATVLEVPVVQRLTGNPANAEDAWVLSMVNAIQTAWILGILLLLRIGGYRLVSRNAASMAVAM